jgi:hypothetical protein
MMSDSRKKLAKWSGTACAFVLGAVLTAIVSGFFDFQSSQRSELVQAQTEAQDAAKELINALVPLSDFATAKSQELKPDDVQALRSKVLSLHEDTQNVVMLLPELKPQFDDYAEAMVQLQRAVSEMDGPYTAKGFVEATSDFFVKKAAFDQKFNALTSSYLGTWGASS